MSSAKLLNVPTTCLSRTRLATKGKRVTGVESSELEGILQKLESIDRRLSEVERLLEQPGPVAEKIEKAHVAVEAWERLCKALVPHL